MAEVSGPASWLIDKKGQSFANKRFAELSKKHGDLLIEVSNQIGQYARAGDNDALLFFHLAFDQMSKISMEVFEQNSKKKETEDE